MLIREGLKEVALVVTEMTVRDKEGKTGFWGVKIKSERWPKAWSLA